MEFVSMKEKEESFNVGFFECVYADSRSRLRGLIKVTTDTTQVPILFSQFL